MDPQANKQTVRLGLYLAVDFRLLAGATGGNTQQPDITPTAINEQIVEIKNLDALWDEHIKKNVPWPVTASEEDDATNAVYSEKLARDILAKLNLLFPKATTTYDLKSANAEFASVSQKAWLLTLDGLHKKGHVTGRATRTGYGPTLHEIHGLEITNEGRIALQNTLQSPRSCYWALAQEFGRSSWKRWAGTIVSAAIGTLVSYLVQRDPQPLSKETILATILGAAVFLCFDLISSSWRLHENLYKPERLKASHAAGIVGLILFVSLVTAGATSIYLNVMPKRHRYALYPTDSNYPAVQNTLGAFFNLKANYPNCAVRITAPFENRNVAQVLADFGRYFCKIDKVEFNPVVPQDDVLKGSVDNGVMIHMAKEPQTRDAFVTSMGNVFSIRRTYDLPPGSPPDLIWLQIGRGYLFRNGDGRSSMH